MSSRKLIINYDPDNGPGFYAAVENDANIFRFMGENPTEQQQRVERLAQLMSEYEGDAEAIIDELPVLLDWPDGISSEEMFETLFETTDSIEYLSETVFAVAEAGDVLVDVLAEAGTALLLAL